MEKTCSKCHKEKPIGEFYSRPNRPIGFSSHCKGCIAQTNSTGRKKRTLREGTSWMNRKNARYKDAHPNSWLLGQARHRAKKRGMPCTVTAKELLPLPIHCPVLGILLRRGKFFKDPQGYSIDRIDNAQGYTPENTAVISLRANLLKKNATADESVGLAHYQVERAQRFGFDGAGI